MKPKPLAVLLSLVAALVLAACTPLAPAAAPAPAVAPAATSAAPVAQAAPEQPAADPLPSWNEGPTKTTILKFIADATDPNGPQFIPLADRIVVSDNDGTLWTEMPVPAQAAFVFARIQAMAKDHPEWATTQPYAAILSGDQEAIKAFTPEQIEELMFTTHAGMSQEEFENVARDFFATALHPQFKVSYTQTVYQPMLELLDLLRANHFQPYIVSGGGADFMRAFAPDVYGIPTDDVVGSSLQYEFKQTSPITGDLFRLPEMVTFDDKTMKPVNIQRNIGKRPVMAIGNSDGDLAMFQYTGGGKLPFLNLLVVHDDADREYDYDSGTDAVRTAAAQSPWLFVSIKKDFKTVFPPSPPEAGTASAGAAQPAAASQAAPAPDPGLTAPVTGGVPLKDTLPSMTPQDVWQNFYNITQVPRPSGHVEQMRAFLVDFGKGLNLDTTVDEAGNVLIRKPASKGMEDRPGVVMQAHMDMVGTPRPGTTFDFETQPIQAYVAGDWVHASDTTLGADNGIGMAIIMAMLQRKDLIAPAIEALFTVDEETTMAGANGLKPGVLEGGSYINLDSEVEGEFTIGSAGGLTQKNVLAFQTGGEPQGTATAFYTVTVTGLTGGHSGLDIDKGRGSATKLMVRLLRPAGEWYGLRLASLQGGEHHNSIPSQATALVMLPTANYQAFDDYLKQSEATFRKELAAVDPKLTVGWITSTVSGPAPALMTLSSQNRVLDALNANPQGVLRMSDAVPGLVETSNNLGLVATADGFVTATNLSRGSVDSELADAGAMITSVWDLAGAQTTVTDRYPGWTPDPESPLLDLFMQTYKQLYADKEPAYTALHAGLECGTVASKYPEMDFISMGPTLVDVHNADERLQVSTVPRVVDLIVAVLGQVPAK
jgi:dipeptidase D